MYEYILFCMWRRRRISCEYLFKGKNKDRIETIPVVTQQKAWILIRMQWILIHNTECFYDAVSRIDFCNLSKDDWFSATKGLQGDVVYLGWQIAPSYTSPNAGIGRGSAGSQPMSTDSCSHHVIWSPNKLWRSNSIFKYECYNHTSNVNGFFITLFRI